MKNIKTFLESKMAKAQIQATQLRMRLQSVQGDSNLASIIFITVCVIVVISVVFFPQLTSMVKGVFTKAGDVLNSIWNFS